MLRRPQGLAFLPRAFVIPLPFFKIIVFPFDALGGLFAGCACGAFIYPFLLCFLKNFSFPFDALRPRGGPYFLLLQKVGKDRRKGVSPPCESPDQSGVLDAPLWKPPSPRWRGKFSRTPRRFAAGASVPLGKAASACALATAAAPPPLRGGGCAPLAPAFPVRKSLLVMRARAWDRVRNGFSGNAHANLPEAPAAEAARSSVTLLARLCRRHSSATASGESQRGRSPLWPVFAYFLLARK